MLSAHVVPSRGGRTQWADMRAAYDALSDEMKAKVRTLSAHHSYAYSQAKIGEEVVVGSRYGFFDGPAPLRPLVKIHPATGRPSLLIGRHAYGIPGMSEEESEELLATLLEDACRPPRTYTHDWTVGDLVVWDNRCVLHRAEPWDWNEPRSMLHTRISGDPVTEGS
jgi:alpha-ketoglutarate-dependent taurine dioxygenase